MYTYICIYIHINICIIHTYELTKKKNIFKKRQNSSYIIDQREDRSIVFPLFVGH